MAHCEKSDWRFLFIVRQLPTLFMTFFTSSSLKSAYVDFKASSQAPCVIANDARDTTSTMRLRTKSYVLKIIYLRDSVAGVASTAFQHCLREILGWNI
uniref:Uncharacterized protein n=1 Tax=Kalanchoe fedtschenkoi TaxID=63787 RepID=A0A7N1A034_KALFE